MRLRDYLRARDEVFESRVIFELIRTKSVSNEVAREIAAAAFGKAREDWNEVEPDAIRDAVDRTDLPSNGRSRARVRG